jgi:hypothetical protein
MSDEKPKKIREKFALVKLDGTGITESGRIKEHDWFRGLELNESKYSDILLTPSEAQRLKSAHQRLKTGAAASVPLQCHGPTVCPVADTCPYVQIQKEIDLRGEERNVVPIGRPCPVEQDGLHDAVSRYASQFGVTSREEDYTDQRILLELAETEVLESRMNRLLAVKHQDLTEEKTVAVIEDEYGHLQEKKVKDIADALKVKEKLWRRRERLFKMLVATREGQYKRDAAVGNSVNNDLSSVHAQLLEKLAKLENKPED